MKTCAREDCENEFTQKTHNQRYCSNECCRIATNKRMKEKYYAKRDQRNGVKRLCTVCSITVLSRYNDTMVCGACAARLNTERKKSVTLRMGAILTA